jgi:endonuclease G, mitochondrial
MTTVSGLFNEAKLVGEGSTVSILERLRRANANVESSDPKLAIEVSVAVRALQPESLPYTLGAQPESIIHRTQRPVLTVANDTALLELDAASEIWRQRLTDAQNHLTKAIRAVGRIEVANHALAWVGTGWLIDQDIVVTNRHVAQEFVTRRGEQFVFRQGFDGASVAPSIDLVCERDRVGPQFALEEALHVEPDDGPDVAFLRVVPIADHGLPERIDLAPWTPNPDRQVVVIGFPARDYRVPDLALMAEIFGQVFDCKRVAPGQVRKTESGLLMHDCSTLGGNSGSVVLDLATGLAVGLHFRGRFLDTNYAVLAATVGDLLASRCRRSQAAWAGSASLATGVDDVTTATFPPPVRVEPSTAATPTAAAPQAKTPPGRHDASYLPPVVDDEDPVDGGEGEARPEDYQDRPGYLPNFVGENVPLPDIHADGDVLRFWLDGVKEQELRYQHFSVVMSQSRRLCWFSAVNIDGGRTRAAARPAWRRDPRIERDAQVLRECYGNQPRFSRGHMTRREDPIWGERADAIRGGADSMHVTNAVPQIQPFNAGIWLQLENYALENAREDRMKISVLTGPVLATTDPVRYGVQIPVTFWKVIVFIHEGTDVPCATGYLLDQSSFLSDEEFVYGKHQTAQVPLSQIERRAGLSFADNLRRLDPLERDDGGDESVAKPLRRVGEIRFR